MKVFSFAFIIPLGAGLLSSALANPISHDAPQPESLAVRSDEVIHESFEGVNATTTAAKREDHEPLSKRDWCNDPSMGEFDMSDALALQKDLQNNNPSQLFPVNHGGWQSWTLRTARICISNNYIFENTHVSRWEAGWAIGYDIQICCTKNASRW